MIPRYSRIEMANIWSEDNKYKIWYLIELYACEAQAELGVIPKDAIENIKNNAQFDVHKIEEIEKITKHDVIAFLTNLAENIGADARFIHQGMTSSDVVDTCLSVQLVQACDLLLQDIEKILDTLKKRSYETKDMMCIGRSHGIHGEPITFGLKLAYAYAEFKRNYNRLKQARAEIAICAISGAMGNFATIDPYVQKYVAKKLGLVEEDISTQIIPRDRHAMFFATLGVIASSVERVAVEIRHLQRTEVYEAEEFFAPGQKGSSAMPHKRNPILSENITGLARLVRGYVTPALENIALWHERDISHSSVERMIAPDSTVTLDFALVRLNNILENLVLYPDNMRRNMQQLNNIYFSQRVLLALTQKNLSREDAYVFVQNSAMRVWKENTDFKNMLLENCDITNHLSKSEIEELFDLSYYTKHVEYIFNKVFQN